MDLKFDPENPKYEYITTKQHAQKALEELKKDKIIAVDVEANSLDPFTGLLVLVQMGNEEISYIFDTRVVNLGEMPLFKELLEDPKRIKLLQNGKFDYKYIRVKYDVGINNIFDTMLAERVLTAGLRMSYGLGDISGRYVQEGILDKTLQKTFQDATMHSRLTDEQLRYAGNDTLVLFPIFQKQLAKLKREDLIKIAKLEFAVTTVVGDMELKGIYLDEQKWRDILSQLAEKRNALEQEFQNAIRPYYEITQSGLFTDNPPVININSQQQLMDLFNNKLHLNMPSTGVAILNSVNNPIVKLLREYRGYEKLLSAFGETLLAKINPKTGRIHPDFMQLQTATGRFACKDPNLQQIPRNTGEVSFRECFNPSPGYKFVVADYSSFEMRILADLSGDEKFIEAFKGGLDMHSYTASLMFEKPYTDDFKKKYPDLRQAAKAIGFGLMYGMGPVGLAARLECSNDQAEEYMKKYFDSYPKVSAFLESMAKNAVQKGWSTTPAGRKRWYVKPDKTDPDYRRKISSIQRRAKNHPIQGTNADAIKYALKFVQDRIKKDGVDGDLILTVHDEIVCEVREDQAEEFSKVLSDEMVRAAELFITKVPVVSDPFVGEVWEH